MEIEKSRPRAAIVERWARADNLCHLLPKSISLQAQIMPEWPLHASALQLQQLYGAYDCSVLTLRSKCQVKITGIRFQKIQKDIRCDYCHDNQSFGMPDASGI